MFKSLVDREIKINTTNNIWLVTRDGYLKKTFKHWQGLGGIAILFQQWWECKVGQLLLRKLNKHSPYGLALFLSGIHSDKKMCVPTKVSTQMFIEVSFSIARSKKPVFTYRRMHRPHPYAHKHLTHHMASPTPCPLS